MKNEYTVADNLAQKIEELEKRQQQQLQEIKSSFMELSERLSPATLFRTAVKTVVSEPGLRTTAIDTAISAGAGLLGKKMLFGSSGGFFKKLAGMAVQFAVTNFVRNKMPSVKRKSSANSLGIHSQLENNTQQ